MASLMRIRCGFFKYRRFGSALSSCPLCCFELRGERWSVFVTFGNCIHNRPVSALFEAAVDIMGLKDRT